MWSSIGPRAVRLESGMRDLDHAISRSFRKYLRTRVADRQWQTVEVRLEEFAEKETVLRLFQRVLLVPAVNAGNAYWRNLRLD
jgi:hypothetical protein